MVENPDKVVVLEVDTCSCGQNLDRVESSKMIKRQSFDLPKIKMMVTQFEQYTKVCPCCNSVNTKAFPKGMTATTQYGDNLRSFMAYCSTYQMIPYDRISEMIEDLTSHKLSNGTIYNTLNSYHKKLESYKEHIKALAHKTKVIHCDETGANVKGKLHWIHTVSSTLMTYYMLHAKRGTSIPNIFYRRILKGSAWPDTTPVITARFSVKDDDGNVGYTDTLIQSPSSIVPTVLYPMLLD